MKKRYKLSWFFLLVSILLLCASCGKQTNLVEQTDNTDTLEFLSQKEAEIIMSSRIQSEKTVPSLFTLTSSGNKAEVVYAETNKGRKTFYLPVDTEDNSWDDLFLVAGDGCSVSLISDDGESPDKISSVQEGTTFQVLFYGDSYYQTAKLIFTGMPVISVTPMKQNGTVMLSTSIGDDDVLMQFMFYDARDDETGDIKAVCTPGYIRLRGATSASYEKHSFRFSLVKDSDFSDSRQVSLCGLRTDDDWILNAMYQEETKVRDMLSYDLWQTIGGDGYDDGTVLGTRMRYVEVILGGEYWGVYGLCEPEDAKQFGISEEDPGVIYRVGTWEVPSVSEIQNAAKNHDSLVSNVSIKYPDEADITSITWAPFREYVETTFESSGQYFDKTITEIVDMDNMIDYWIFLNITANVDSTWKNMFLIYRESNGKLMMVPWDCDISFGLSWESDTYLHLYHADYTWDDILSLVCSERMIRRNTENAQTVLKEKWEKLKSDGLSAEYIIEKARSYRAYLEDSGALARNREKWPDSGYIDNLDYLESFVKYRWTVIDHYISELEG